MDLAVARNRVQDRRLARPGAHSAPDRQVCGHQPAKLISNGVVSESQCPRQVFDRAWAVTELSEDISSGTVQPHYWIRHGK